MVETICQLDLELAYYDLQIARLLTRRRQQLQPRPRAGRGRRPPKRRSFWVTSWMLDRPIDGQFRWLMDKLLVNDISGFKNFTRMDPDVFFELVEKLTPLIQKEDTTFREAISPAERLALTLRFLATGECYYSLRYNWVMGDNTISKIVRQVCQAIIQVLGQEEELILPPTTEEGWLQVAETFSKRWNFHHTLGALDGKHIRIRKPAKSGSLYYNYKGFFSITLMALVDANYKFLWVDVGSNGASSDSQLFNGCELKEMIELEELCIPKPEPLPGGEVDVPYFLIGDDAFALRTWLMKPYSKKDMSKEELAFNYRLSRGRMVVENAFGILANRFGCLLTTLRLCPDTATDIVLTCCLLHNLLRDKTLEASTRLIDEDVEDHNVVAGAVNTDGDLTPGNSTCARNTGSLEAKKQRDYLKDYYNSDLGSVSWQDKALDYWRREDH